ncbi:hypothetical protein PIROE2DRAFT_9845 [Piromyces sp. E2]|nr:hypothetical protein PIROE2DRAFT_9845 [Piromyces sp. E2]|eukprot:OUM63565.1 hypothetical protein PIROE2DRAFT_9845 [Piromyces sp. E2]
MKLGGNENAKVFFNQHGGVDKYNDPKDKYQSKAAILYKEYLNKLVEEDIKKYPDKIIIDEIQQEKPEEDFFSSWENKSKNNSIESSSASSPKSLSSSSLSSTPAPIPIKPRNKHTPGSLLKPKNKKNVKASKIIKGVNFEEVAKRVKEEEKKKKNKDKDGNTFQLIFILLFFIIIIIILCNVLAFIINIFI